ncbi:MAG: hypothetical protein IT378_05835, partial [Sandaracinaceae bacterium]|nr:hypothetical protein [Sandaracinaceae bacterium]
QAIVRLAREVGAEVVTAIVSASEAHLDAGAIGARRVLFEPGVTGSLRAIEEDFDGPDAAHLLITHGKLIDMIADGDVPFLEHGFPSYFTHATFDAPVLGYRGALWLLGQIANRLALCEAMGIGKRRRSLPARARSSPESSASSRP